MAIGSGEYLSTASLRIYCNVAESYRISRDGVRLKRFVRALNIKSQGRVTGNSDRGKKDSTLNIY